MERGVLYPNVIKEEVEWEDGSAMHVKQVDDIDIKEEDLTCVKEEVEKKLDDYEMNFLFQEENENVGGIIYFYHFNRPDI